ncbi:MAG: diguanylate cyclase domain-containing protein [Methylocystis sp.]|uniref:diguanylate cyclase domain-containing protein n=1 Tax=Methylocystis sp. TaxID=1911079 RepID=UPI003DA5CE57
MVDAIFHGAVSVLARLREIVAEPGDPEKAASWRKEQFGVLRRHTPGMMVANIGNAFALFATLRDTPMAMQAALWTQAVMLFCGYLYLRARRRPGAGRAAAPEAARTGGRAIVYALFLGLLWAAPPLLFFQPARPGAQLMIATLTAGMLFGGAFALARAPLAAAAFALPVGLASAVALLKSGGADFTRVAVVLCIYLAVLGRGVCVEAETFKARILAQFDAERQARTDPLTGLPNRLAFIDAMERELARMRRHGGSFLLLCVDFDNFKTINDGLGHPAGDELLTQAASRMRAALRGSDFVGRLGGDEFAVIATEVGCAESARLLAARIVACFEAPFILDGCPVRCAVSVGGALGPRHGADQQALFKSADVALYQAKAQGGGWRLFEPPHAGARADWIDSADPAAA